MNFRRISSLLNFWAKPTFGMKIDPTSSSRLLNNPASSSAPSFIRAMASAEKLVHPKGSGSVINPRQLLGKEILTMNISKLLGTGHPVLNTISNYYFSQQGKHIRPLIVLLMSQATSSLRNPNRIIINQQLLDTPVSSAREESFASSIAADEVPLILPSQKRLAEITEMIHTASLLHDDVIDVSMTRRSKPSANAEFGNKMAILAGDFLLARASVALARLRNVEVVELLATVISNLVEGEFMQLKNGESSDGSAMLSNLDYYLEKTYLKTASLIAKSCRACVVLGECGENVADISYDYGRNIGLAFQLIDDMLDFVASADQLGKPVYADLKLGLATAPVLYAAEEFPELWPLIDRKFSHEGDVETSDGIAKTRELAEKYISQAVASIIQLPESSARDALVNLTYSVVNRTK